MVYTFYAYINPTLPKANDTFNNILLQKMENIAFMYISGINWVYICFCRR